MFGATMAFALVRFWLMGWIDEIYLEPSFHFTWPCLPFVVPPSPWIYLLWATAIAAAVLLAVGVYARVCAGVYFVIFTYMEFCEQAAYLNHYWLVSLMALLLAVVRTDQRFALVPERRSKNERGAVATTTLWLLRGQVIAVYLSAGLAKLGPDWLLRGEPLRTWLWMHEDIPLIGPLLVSTPWIAIAMSWAGMVFDCTIWLWLLWERTRRYAFVVAVGFHLVVWLLFPIGMFSFIMVGAATLLLSPTWADKAPSPNAAGNTGRGKLAKVAVVLWVAVQLLVPQRHMLTSGVTNWTELDFRFAWRVMLIEKTGTVEYRVVTKRAPDGVRVFPRDGLSRLQHRQLVTQPDMMLAYAHNLRDLALARGEEDVRVYVDAWVSLNGRRAQPIIDPAFNLASAPRECRFLDDAPYLVPLREP